MDKRTSLEAPPGVTIRQMKSGARLQIFFVHQGQQCRELLPECPITKASLQYAANLRGEIRRKIDDSTFVYAEYFPDSPRAKVEVAEKERNLLQELLAKQLGIYTKQVESGKMSPSTLVGYKKAITGERMRHWDGWTLREVTPSAIREWVSEMDCTSKAIRNLLIPLRSVFEDALNDELIDFNPFDRIALSKLIKQTSKASDYVIEPFTRAERDAILAACRPDERPTFQFWFATGLRPGELQALEWRHIDFDKATARIELNQVAGVVKAPKTAAGIRAVDLDQDAIDALKAQKAISGTQSERIWLNPRTMKSWETDAQVRKTAWLPIMARSGIKYRNMYQIRHTYASTILTAGANPWYVAAQLGHEDVEMVFRTYGKFIREDYQKPRPALRAVG
ncbi:site-specific integrase [Comamonas antarctica]|uniref:site-specific integrase n=1 Tax=Comamonas antarctica TaxID=2743470 RepID=UPI0028E47DCF|nr:site-specific integrase [Comamonas antarctica]